VIAIYVDLISDTKFNGLQVNTPVIPYLTLKTLVPTILHHQSVQNAKERSQSFGKGPAL